MMKKILLALMLTLILAASLASAQTYENSSVIGQVQDRVVITVKVGTKMAYDKADGTVKVGVPSLDALSTKFAVHNMEQMYAGMTEKLKSKADRSALERVWAVDFPEAMGLKEVQAAYAALPEVEEVRLVDICKMYDAYLPNDINSNQYYLRNMSPGMPDMRGVGAWNQALGDSNIIVAVTDSGVDWHHPDLGGTHPDKVNGAIWTNWPEYYGTPGVDDDDNGRIDDIRGWDFVNVPASYGWPDEDVTTADNDPMDYGGHGTNCSGCVAPITNNDIGIAGTAPGCKIMAVRVGYLPDGETGGIVRMDFCSQGIVYATISGAKIINCSWGSTSYLYSACNAAQNEGVLIVTAAGNDNSSDSPSYLGTRAGVIAVAATTSDDSRASFSNFGSWVELAAPGSGIYTTAYNRLDQTSTYATVDGTSFSSPLTAGAAALLWSANPTMTYQQITTLLLDSADNIDALNPGYEGLLGSGRVNMLRALGDTQHRYPEEFPTLYDAFNSASDGDEVAIEGGISIDPIMVIGRAMEVNGGYSSDYTSRDPINNPTTIQGNSTTTGLKFYGTVEPSTIVDGFIVRDGGGQTMSSIPNTGRYGGGVALFNASPTLRNIEVTNNSVGSSSQLGAGGGIMMYNSHAVLENVHVHGNTAIYGGGVYAYLSSPSLTGCTIENNAMITDNFTYDHPLGGGVHVINSSLSMTDCTVRNHTDCWEGGGIYATDGSILDLDGGLIANNTYKANGGGVYLAGGSLTMNRVETSDNIDTDATVFSKGGGIYASAASVSLDSLVVASNTSIFGGGVAFDNCSQADVTNSVIHGNSSQIFGAAVYYLSTAAGSVTNNTIVGNASPGGGGAGVFVTGVTPDIDNNIIAFNTGGAGSANGVALASAPGSFTCNDVFGNENADFSGMTDPTGTDGNISENPLFCGQPDGNFGIIPTSPCSAANSGGCGLIGALDVVSCSSAVPGEDSALPTVFRVEQNFPNPFNPSTTIRFALPAKAHTSVVIFDLAGRRVKTLVDDIMAAQVHEAVWTGKDDSGRSVSAGVYFYRVISGDHLSVGRMALVK
jgi:subtilisin family serine protease